MTRFRALLHPGFFALFFLVAMLPTIYCITNYVSKTRKLQAHAEEFDGLVPMVEKVLTNKNCLSQFLQRYGDADRLYCEKHLENLKFLHSETEQLKFLSAYQSFANCSMLKKRRDHLSGKGNQICFTQGPINEVKGIRETEERLMHPIELDCDDLKHLLSLIEGAKIGQYSSATGRPQLIFKSFEMQKRTDSHGGENYVVNFVLLKREKTPTS